MGTWVYTALWETSFGRSRSAPYFAARSLRCMALHGEEWATYRGEPSRRDQEWPQLDGNFERPAVKLVERISVWEGSGPMNPFRWYNLVVVWTDKSPNIITMIQAKLAPQTCD